VVPRRLGVVLGAVTELSNEVLVALAISVASGLLSKDLLDFVAIVIVTILVIVPVIT
jgi:hypothetical protein